MTIMMKPGHLKGLVFLLLTLIFVFEQNKQSLVPSAPKNDLESCFQSLAGIFNHQLQCNSNNSTASSHGNQNNPMNVFVGCLEQSIKTMDSSCSAKVLDDPNTLLSLYKGNTILFSEENSELCKGIQDHLQQIGLGTTTVSRPEEPREKFFGCRAFVHEVLFCCT